MRENKKRERRIDPKTRDQKSLWPKWLESEAGGKGREGQGLDRFRVEGGG